MTHPDPRAKQAEEAPAPKHEAKPPKVEYPPDFEPFTAAVKAFEASAAQLKTAADSIEPEGARRVESGLREATGILISARAMLDEAARHIASGVSPTKDHPAKK